MQRLGIETGADLKAKSLAFLRQHFGKSAAWYLGIANGEDDRPVVADRPRKSSGSETTFARDLTIAAEIEAGVEAMADEVWAWCEKAKAFGRTVTVKVKFADFQQITRSRSFQGPITRRDLLRQLSVELVRMLLPTAKGVRLLGVTVSNFGSAPADTDGALPLFAAGAHCEPSFAASGAP
jgi:DNA polymerase-4